VPDGFLFSDNSDQPVQTVEEFGIAPLRPLRLDGNRKPGVGQDRDHDPGQDCCAGRRSAVSRPGATD
jgi:hypothetical protein